MDILIISTSPFLFYYHYLNKYRLEIYLVTYFVYSPIIHHQLLFTHHLLLIHFRFYLLQPLKYITKIKLFYPINKILIYIYKY